MKAVGDMVDKLPVQYLIRLIAKTVLYNAIPTPNDITNTKLALAETFIFGRLTGYDKMCQFYRCCGLSRWMVNSRQADENARPICYYTYYKIL